MLIDCIWFWLELISTLDDIVVDCCLLTGGTVKITLALLLINGELILENCELVDTGETIESGDGEWLLKILIIRAVDGLKFIVGTSNSLNELGEFKLILLNDLIDFGVKGDAGDEMNAWFKKFEGIGGLFVTISLFFSLLLGLDRCV